MTLNIFLVSFLKTISWYLPITDKQNMKQHFYLSFWEHSDHLFYFRTLERQTGCFILAPSKQAYPLTPSSFYKLPQRFIENCGQFKKKLEKVSQHALLK